MVLPLMVKHKVLSTKKLEPSLVEQANQNGIEIIEQEFISVKPILSKEKQDEIMPWLQKKVSYCRCLYKRKCSRSGDTTICQRTMRANRAIGTYSAFPAEQKMP